MRTDPTIAYNTGSSLPERRKSHSPNSNHLPMVGQCTPVAIPALLVISVRHKMRMLIQNIDREVALTATKEGL